MARPVLLPLKKKKKRLARPLPGTVFRNARLPVPLGTLYVGSSARCHCFCALRSRWLTSGPSSGLLALCLARHCPAILTLRSVCLGHPSAHPSCALASCIGGSSWARRCTFWPACVRSWHFRPRDFTALAAPLGLLVCVWLTLVLSTARCVVTSFSGSPIGTTLDPPACTLPAVCRGRSHSQSFPASFSRFIRGSLCRRSC